MVAMKKSGMTCELYVWIVCAIMSMWVEYSLKKHELILIVTVQKKK